jgi:hypothetical protein
MRKRSCTKRVYEDSDLIFKELKTKKIKISQEVYYRAIIGAIEPANLPEFSLQIILQSCLSKDIEAIKPAFYV